MSKDWPLYEVFIRTKSGLSHRHAGSVHAADDEMALNHARDVIRVVTKVSAYGLSGRAKLSPRTRRIQQHCSNQRRIKFIATRLFMRFLMMSGICDRG